MFFAPNLTHFILEVMQRLFIAIDLPAAVKHSLREISCGVPGARWMTDEQLHLTLVFLGEVNGATALDVGEALDEISCEPFSLTLKGVGHFPPRGHPRVLWVGVEKQDTLMFLQKRLANAVERLGVEIEKRKFTPHITLARLHEVHSDDVGHYIQHHNLLRCGPFEVREFQLLSSTLNPKGARYAVEATYLLSGVKP